MATSLNEGNLEKRLQTVSNTQESIQSLSLWCLHHKSHFKKIIDIWIKVLKKAKVSHRLALFYLANDVIQNSRRKGCPQFSEAWQPMIKQAVPYVSDDKIRIQIERILNIWEDRNIYDAQFISEMHKVIASNQPKQTEQVAVEAKLLADFKPQKLADKIKKYRKLETDIDAKQKHFTGLKMDVCNTETLKQLKDKAHGTKFSKDFEDATNKLDEFVQVLEKSVKDRTAVITMLEQSETFYEVQKKEAKIVANAYKNFGNRVKNLQNKLKEFIPNLPSPVPSLNADAPSPVDSSDEETEVGTGLTKSVTPKTETHKDVNSRDNTEAIDMEMSEEDSNHPPHLNKDVDAMAASDGVPSPPGSAPSPDGSPVGLNLSPSPIHQTHSKSPVSSIPPSNSTSKVAAASNAAPALQIKVSAASSLFANLSKSNSSSSSSPIANQSKNSASSLDIRLSNLMQSIPNFTSNFFGGRVSLDGIPEKKAAETVPSTTSTNTTVAVGKSSPAGPDSSKAVQSAEEGGTPLKDEESGTGSATPLQDESRAGEARKAATPNSNNNGITADLDPSDGVSGRPGWKLVQERPFPPVAVPTAAATMRSSTGYGPTDNGGDASFYSAPPWSADNEPTGTSNNIVDILQKLAAGTAMKPSMTTASSWINLPPTVSESPVMPPAVRQWYDQPPCHPPFDGFSPPAQPSLPSYLDPYDPEIQFPTDIMNGIDIDDINLPDELPVSRPSLSLTGGYRRNSNIVELTPSPSGSPDFDAAAAPPQSSCNSRNLITIVQSAPGDNVSTQDALANKKPSPPLVRCPPMAGTVGGSIGRMPNAPGGMDGNHLHAKTNNVPPPSGFVDRNDGSSNNPASANKERSLVSDEEDEIYSRIETLDCRRDEPPTGSEMPGVGMPWNVSTGARPHFTQHEAQSQSSSTGWHQIFPISANPTPPPPRRDGPNYGGFGFRFPQRGGMPRREWRDHQGGGHSAKRPPPPPMMPMRAHGWQHSQRRPY